MPRHLASLGSGAGVYAYTQKIKAIAPANLIAYWPLADLSGTTALDVSGNGYDGSYVNTPTLGQPGIGDGRTAPLFTAASNQYTNIYSAGLAAAFSGAEGTLALWLKVSGSGVWTDGVARVLAYFRADANNIVGIYKNTTNNQLRTDRTAGGATKSVSITASPTIYTHIAMTWSKAADQMIAYLSGAQTGSTQTGLGTYSGSPASTSTCLGASSTTPTLLWSGNIAHVALWTTPLTANQVASLAIVP